MKATILYSKDYFPRHFFNVVLSSSSLKGFLRINIPLFLNSSSSSVVIKAEHTTILGFCVLLLSLFMSSVPFPSGILRSIKRISMSLDSSFEEASVIFDAVITS